MVTGLGGHGIAALYQGIEPGPRVMVRCELDALPLPDGSGAYHGCGHDGHMAIAVQLAELLAETPLERGSVLLLFQPAEETGAGAAAVLSEPGFLSMKPDFAVALHNLPGYAEGEAVIRPGVFASASVGLTVGLTGTRSHAGEPDRGRSPALAVAQLIQAFSAVPQFHTGLFQPGKVTVIHARLGTRAFGTSPGEAVVMATLRTADSELLRRLLAHCRRVAEGVAETFGLTSTIDTEEEFPPVINDPRCTEAVERAATSLGIRVNTVDQPFPWSEDFGHFTSMMPGVLFGLGAGTDRLPLHHPEYTFPDRLIPAGGRLLLETVKELVSGETPCHP